MRTRTVRISRALLVLALVAAVGVLTGSPAAAAAVNIDLCASATTLGLPGGVSVPVWGFGLGAAGSCASATPTLPGPVLTVNEGDTVNVTVHNALTEDISFEVPALFVNEGVRPVAPGAAATFTFTATGPGSYLYASPANAGRQLAMGLSGALIVRSNTAGWAYDSSATAYDSEAVLVLSAIDPLFNADPNGYDVHAFRATFWLINGKAYPDTAVIHAGAGSKVLLRYVNAGYDNSTMALLGLHQRVIGRDGHPLANPFDAVADTIPAGAAEDTIATVPGSGASFPLYNRQLHLTNGAPSNPAHQPGGALTFIQVP